MLVDDHPMVRRGLATMLMVFDDMRLVGEAESGQAAIQLCARQRQLERFSGLGIICNADMRVAEVRKFCPVLRSGLSQTGRNRRQSGARGNEPDEFISPCLSPNPETGAHNCGPGRQRPNPNASRGRGATV